MRQRRTLVIAGLMVMIAGCATGPAAPPSVDVSGKWAGTWAFAWGRPDMDPAGAARTPVVTV